MRSVQLIIIVVISCMIAIPSFAQSDSTKPRMTVSLGMFYNSGLNYYGRTDSLKSTGAFPLAELSFRDGFYVNAAPVFINNSQQQFDYAGTIVTAGYRIHQVKKVSGNISVIKPFYRDNSKLVQSSLKAQATGSITWNNKLLNFTAGADLKFSDAVDYGVNASADHIFRFKPSKKILLALDPAAAIYAGTKHFSETYYKKTSFLFFPGTTTPYTQSSVRFDILAYEFSMPVVLATGKFQLILNPAYVLPQHLEKGEFGKDMFYITAGVRYVLPVH
jgi:hypothetical protein